ncbi:hypothetical protein T440DRAFT_56880 [Plenodomus tracheiphilus IPT5]|uniref:Uncharacterized protein n=1 Tax=Plenodomus tracheiphilus IPT5 TaxID=1408161 RepID=A0A6A7B8N8_9PLEO|nr:hypothetical protein T440DRAFT_56880 [Plenodomus tracheiphilus IPT5]
MSPSLALGASKPMVCSPASPQGHRRQFLAKSFIHAIVRLCLATTLVVSIIHNPFVGFALSLRPVRNISTCRTTLCDSSLDLLGHSLDADHGKWMMMELLDGYEVRTSMKVSEDFRLALRSPLIPGTVARTRLICIPWIYWILLPLWTTSPCRHSRPEFAYPLPDRG